jgi:hypothetical protein
MKLIREVCERCRQFDAYNVESMSEFMEKNPGWIWDPEWGIIVDDYRSMKHAVAGQSSYCKRCPYRLEHMTAGQT